MVPNVFISPVKSMFAIVCLNNLVARYRGKARQTSRLTPRTALSFQRKEELPWVGFKPTTLCSQGELSTNWATQLFGVGIYSTKVVLKPLCYGTVL